MRNLRWRGPSRFVACGRADGRPRSGAPPVACGRANSAAISRALGPLLQLSVLDAAVAACLVPLAAAAVVSGLDDFVLDLCMFRDWWRRRARHLPAPTAAEKRIAIFVPLWHEHGVIGRMLAHNLRSIRYSAYDVFAGVYPNDPETMQAVGEIERRDPRVHAAVVPHDGPTSKADCLNWIYQAMLAHEEACGVRYDLVVTHDAEDVIHPDGLRWINHYADSYDMVQVPVLPLPTPAHHLTHGVYCDEFAEYQTKDVPARRTLGSFLPSNGVGTGYTRRALEALRDGENRIFDPGCLTEDYQCGVRLHRLGFRQYFVPLSLAGGEPMATREYFPQRFRQAVRQRTRWVTGIALQGWERNGWRGGAATVYWFWRDRKGLIGNPLSLLGNLVSLYALLSLAAAALGAQPGAPASIAFGRAGRWLLGAAAASQVFRLLVRAACVARIYGWRFAAGVPIRAVWANWMNAIATLAALATYTRTRLARGKHVWLKTEHTYPSMEPAPVPAVFMAARLDAAALSPSAARALPRCVAEQWRVLPFRITEGRLLLATPSPPEPGLEMRLAHHTRLRIEFHVVSQDAFDRLAAAYH